MLRSLREGIDSVCGGGIVERCGGQQLICADGKVHMICTKA